MNYNGNCHGSVLPCYDIRMCFQESRKIQIYFLCQSSFNKNRLISITKDEETIRDKEDDSVKNMRNMKNIL